MMKRYTFLSLVLTLAGHAQTPGFQIPDSLSRSDCSYLSGRVIKNWNDSIKSSIYAHAWLEKARQANDLKQMVFAYKTLVHKGDKISRLSYADTMVRTARLTGDKLLVGSAYLTRGAVYYERMEHTKALEDYLAANTLISQTNDQYQIYKVKYQIAQAKYLLGFYQEAIALFKQCITYFKTENDRAYLNSLHGLSLCYNSIGKYRLCTEINRLGIEVGKEVGNFSMAPYFMHSEGVNQYSMRNFNTAISKLKKSLVEIKKVRDFPNETVAYFYIGRSYWALKQYETALPFLKKVDAAFISHNYIRPDLRNNYELLVDYYKNKRDYASEIVYLNRLQKIDSILIDNYKYLAPKITREYDTKRILDEKENAEMALKIQRVQSFSIITVMSGTILFLIYRHYRNRKRYRKSFEAVMRRKVSQHEPATGQKGTEFDISPDVVEGILKNLAKFEQNKKYLEKDMNLVKMAAILNTNTKYVSKIIAHFRNKGSIEYISDLKIDYIIESLKTESRFRNYTNKALGEEAGFGSTQNFTKAFKTRTGISPTYFIRQLKKDLEM